MNEPAFVQETLDWCNKRRKENGKSPLDNLPKGRRHQGDSCPCGEATGLVVGLTGYFKRNPKDLQLDHLGDVPPSVTKFVKEFDNGKLPQYDIDKDVNF